MSDSGKPNIVVLLADDLAIWALGCYGNPEIRTPHLDRLAADGVRFTNFFCTSPVCSPSRASLLTGKMPSQHGVQDWIRAGNGVVDPPINYLDGHHSYTETLAEHGYACGISGKWHLGNSKLPQKGHSHWFVHQSGGSRYNDVPMIRNGECVETTGYLSDVITDDAIVFMSKHARAGTPFHASVNFTAPHSPWVDQHPQEYVDLYDECAFESCPQEPRHPWVKSHPIEMDFTERNASPGRRNVTVRDHLQGYFAAVTALDACVGRIREAVRDLGIENDTLIVFTSDNGFNCGHHGIWGKGNATVPQNMYDKSVKVPLLIAMPGHVPAGTECHDLLSGYDFKPTLLDFAGIGPPEDAGLPGRSFLSALHGDEAASDRPVVVYDEFGPTRMIRTREWKYVHRYPYGPHELFDLVYDPGERVNLLADERVWRSDEPDRAELADDLRRRLEEWFAVYSDPDLDGRLQAITGRGQLGLVGSRGTGAVTFHGPETRKVLDERRATGTAAADLASATRKDD